MDNMASIKIQASKMSFFLLSGLVMLSSILAAAEDVVPFPPLSAPTHDYLEQCGTNLHPKCGEEIKVAAFANGKVSDGCCRDLVAEGQACHDKFVEAVAPYYPEPARSKASAKGVQAWNDCTTAARKTK